MFRLVNTFANSFHKEFIKTDAVTNRPYFQITADVDDFISRQRVAVGINPVFFVFYRNLNAKKPRATTVTLARPGRDKIRVHISLPFKHSFVGLANYSTFNGLRLLISTIPIYFRTRTPAGHELWIVHSDQDVTGQFAFQGQVEVRGTLDAVVEAQDDANLVSLKKETGWCRIQQLGKPETAVVVIALSQRDLLTLTPVFRDAHWGEHGGTGPLAVFWGAYGTLFDPKTNKVTVRQSPEDKKLYCISQLDIPGGFAPDDDFDGVVKSVTLKDFDKPQPALPTITFTESRTLDFKALNFIPLESKNGIPTVNLIDLCYTSGYAVYRITFQLDQAPAKMNFELNIRHRAVVYINDQVLGSHIVYSLQSLRAGAKNGPDVGLWGGWKNYDLPQDKLKTGKNEIIVIVESLGLNRCPGTLDDVRNERGILQAKLGKIPLSFEIAGVDVRHLDQQFNVDGFGWKGDYQSFNMASIPSGVTKPSWYRGTFHHHMESKWIAPLRMVLTGDNMAYVTLNGVFIAKYYGLHQGPQHDFFIPDGLLQEKNIIEFMTFGSDSKHSLHIELKYWHVDSYLGSGNVVKEGQEYVLLQRDL
jgi:hypothetical protein